MKHFSNGILWYTLLFPTDNWNRTKQRLGNSWLESKKVFFSFGAQKKSVNFAVLSDSFSMRKLRYKVGNF